MAVIAATNAFVDALTPSRATHASVATDTAPAAPDPLPANLADPNVARVPVSWKTLLIGKPQEKENTNTINENIGKNSRYDLFLHPDYISGYRFCSNLREYSARAQHQYAVWGGLLTGLGIVGVTVFATYLARIVNIENANNSGVPTVTTDGMGMTTQVQTPMRALDYNPSEFGYAIGTAISTAALATGVYLITRSVVAGKKHAAAELLRARISLTGEPISDEEAFRRCAMVRQDWESEQAAQAGDLAKALQGIKPR